MYLMVDFITITRQNIGQIAKKCTNVPVLEQPLVTKINQTLKEEEIASNALLRTLSHA